MSRKQQRTLHKISKQLQREQRHRAWLEQNLRYSQQVKDSRKKMLLSRTEMIEHNSNDGSSIQGKKISKLTLLQMRFFFTTILLIY